MCSAGISFQWHLWVYVLFFTVWIVNCKCIATKSGHAHCSTVPIYHVDSGNGCTTKEFSCVVNSAVHTLLLYIGIFLELVSVFFHFLVNSSRFIDDPQRRLFRITMHRCILWSYCSSKFMCLFFSCCCFSHSFWTNSISVWTHKNSNTNDGVSHLPQNKSA